MPGYDIPDCTLAEVLGDAFDSPRGQLYALVSAK